MTAEVESTERDQETLDLFFEESSESLVRVEQLLLEAEGGERPPNMMATLFRDFHTIKGTSGFLALPKILHLSHAAEDLLAMLRDGSLTARREHFARLMQVVDVLRQLMANVKATNDEGAVDVDVLVVALRADLSAAPARVSVPARPKTDAPARLSVPVRRSLPAVAPPPVLVAPPEPLPDPVVVPAVAHEPPSEPEGEHARETHARGDAADGTVRVNVAVLDRLMNLMGELVLARNQMVQIVRTSKDTNVTALAASQRLSLVTSDLQEQIMKTRMQPVARVFEKIPRMVRDLCKAMGKQVNCQIDGNATEIDKALVEAIRDPLMHIVRNALDHGIEMPATREKSGKPAAGKLSVRASHEGGMVLVEIEDDGAGMDPKKLRAHAVKKGVLSAADAERMTDSEALELVFRPGFSTAAQVTDISGRGVGMDVVRTHVEKAGGQVELDSNFGKGTVIRLKMPLTLAIIPALLVKTGGQRFAIPQVNLLELVYLNEEQMKTTIEHIRGAAIYRLRGEILPLVRLSTVLGLDAGVPVQTSSGVNVVVVAVGSHRYGLLIDEIHDTEEIVIKPLYGQVKRLSCYSGATVLGDGGVALILDVAGVAGRAGIDTSSRRAELASARIEGGMEPQTFLVFSAGAGQQCAVPLSMVARLEQISSSAIERVAGAEVVQYRKSIMPIVRPEDVLPIGKPSAGSTEQQLIVFDFGQPVGMAVSAIIDVVDVVMGADSAVGALPLTFGRAVIFGKATPIVDVYGVVRQLVPQFVQERRQSTPRSRVLVVDDSLAMRSAITGYLQARGMDVVHASNGAVALAEIRSGRVRIDAVVTDLEMPEMTGYTLIDVVKKERPDLPVVVFSFMDDPGLEHAVLASGARAMIHKLKREDLVVALRAAGVGKPVNTEKRAA